MFDLTGKTALVTGAGQSNGRGVAKGLALQGAHVLVNDFVAERAIETVEKIEKAGGTASAVPFDVTDREAVIAALGDHEVDIVICNAGNGGVGGMTPTPFVDLDPADWAGPVDVNVYGVMNCVHAVLRGMIDRGWGRIITISSGAGTVGVDIGVTPYSAGKGGGLSFTRSLALETAAQGITCNSVALGLQSNAGGIGVTDEIAASVPAGRLGTPKDLAALCVYLASEESSYVTGQTIGMNGGRATS
jgi:NAD(P)-dependent dehydrogenase (short-subunit alcohol dehydrogenase family)